MWHPEQLDIAKFAIAEFDPKSTFQAPAQSFEIKTCQRTLFLYGMTPELKSTFSLAKRNYVGSDAYEFLLRFASGLESEIKGETDVFGHHPSLTTCEIELAKAVAQASLIIIATPFKSSIEDVVAENISPKTRVLHLGAQAIETNTLPYTSLSLTDLFEMEKEQCDLRIKQVRQAMDACHERALLRNLSRSIHVAHGWEDLAVFY